MKFDKPESRKMKLQALWWLRCKKRCAFICTEGGGYSSDAIGVNEKDMIEVEVKITKEDLRHDFTKPKHRHYYAIDTVDQTSENRWVPNFFYFMVPKELVHFAVELVNEKKAPYGVINSDGMFVVHRAKRIHKRPPGSEVKFILALRMGSELIRMHESLF